MTLTGSRTRKSLQLIWRGMRETPWIYVWAIGGSAAFGAITVFISRALGWATSNIVAPAIAGDESAQGRIWFAGALLAVLAVLMAVAVWSRRVGASWGVANIGAAYRRRLSAAFLRLPISWHRQHPTGELLAHASSDVDAGTGAFNPLPFALGVVVMILVAAGMLLAIDPWLTLAAFIILPMTILVNLVFQRYMSPAVTRAQKLRADVSDVAHESFEAALLVKSLGTAAVEQARFADKADQLRAANARVGVVRAIFDPVIDVLPQLGTLTVLAVGAWRAGTGAVDAGDVVTAAFLLTIMSVPVRAFGWVLGDLPRTIVGYERIAQVVDNPAELLPGTRTLPSSDDGLAVAFEGVGLDVPVEGREDATLLDGVTLAIAPGSTVAIVGSTGSGKTTLVSLLARLTDPTRGRVLLDGIGICELAASEVPSQVALVAQSTFVFEDSVRANVTLAEDGDSDTFTDDDVWRALDLARMARRVTKLGGLDAQLGESGSNLSGGQRQRLAIARALVRRPRLLVLDDATSAVDPRVEQEILRALREGAGGGTTVVMVAYRMSSVALADTVVHLDGGRVVDVGTHEELLARDAGYAEIATAYEAEAARRADIEAEEGHVYDEDDEDDDDEEGEEAR